MKPARHSHHTRRPKPKPISLGPKSVDTAGPYLTVTQIVRPKRKR